MGKKETNDEQRKALDKIQPSLDNFIRKVHNTAPDLCVTGFIYGMEPPILFHFGNIANTPEEIFQIHQRLGYLFCAHALGDKLNREMIEVDIETPAPEDVADSLALKLLTSPDTPEDVHKMAKDYLEARRPTETPTPKQDPEKPKEGE